MKYNHEQKKKKQMKAVNSKTENQNDTKKKSSGSETMVYQREKADEDQEFTVWDGITKSN